MRTTILACIVTVSFQAANLRAADIRQISLAADQAELLQFLDHKTAADVIAIAQEVERWRREVQNVRQAIEALGDEASLDRNQKNQLVGLGKSLERLSPELRRQIGFNPQPFQRLSGSTGQAEIVAARQVLDQLNKVFSKIKNLRDPAQYARDFLENEIDRRYFNEPYEAGDLRFTIQRDGVDRTKSLFSPEASVAIAIQYQEGLEVEATGLYFAYRNGSLPEPQFDRMKLTTDVSALVNNGLKHLGDVIPADYGLPISIQNPRFNGFTGPKAGSLSFDISVGGLLEFCSDLKLEAKGVTILSDGKVDAPGGLKGTIPGQVPIGTTPLAFEDVDIELNPENRTKSVTLGTNIVVAGAGKNAVALEVEVTFGFPVREIAMEGALVLGGTERIGEVSGSISATRVAGTLSIPAPGANLPWEKLLEAKFDFELNREGFTGSGMVALFQAVEANFSMAIRLDGSGYLAANKSLSIAGIDVRASLYVEVEEAFKNFEMEASLSVEVDLKVFEATASVLVRGSTKSNPAILVQAKAMGATVEFRVNSLDDIRPDRIAKELLKELEDILQNIAQAAAKWEKDKRHLMAKWDSHWRETLHNEAKKYGLDKVSTGDPNVDAFLGSIARDGKAGGKWASDVWKKSGSEWYKFSHDPLQSISDLPGNAAREFKNVGKGIENTVNTILGNGHRNKKKSNPAVLRAERLAREFDAKVADLKAAIEATQIVRVPPAQIQQAGNGHTLRVARELHLDLRDVANGTLGNGGGTVGLIVAAAGNMSSINSRMGKADRKTSSDVAAATIEFKNLVGDPANPNSQENLQPKADVTVDEFEDASGFNGRTLARHKLQELIELYLPEVEIEGRRRFEESRISIVNKTGETVTAWVQVERRHTVDRQFKWRWEPAVPGSLNGYRFQLSANSEPIELRYEDILSESGREGPIHGRRVRVWFEGESGERWTEHQHQDLWLVQPNPTLGDERAYDDESMHVHTYSLENPARDRVLSERVLEFHNTTNAELNLQARYQTNERGRVLWKNLNATMAPGETLKPRNHSGLRIRASSVQFRAENNVHRFVKHASSPLWLVPETHGRRVYKAKKIGKWVYNFESSGTSGSGTSAKVTTAQANIQSGQTVLGTASRNQLLAVEEIRDQWVKVKFGSSGKQRSGWIQRNHVALTEAGPRKPPSESRRRSITVTEDGAKVQVGTYVIAKLPRGMVFPVLEKRDGWYRIEIKVKGQVRHGWVQRSNVKVQD